MSFENTSEYCIFQGSWAKAISDRLKNMRRKPRAKSAGLEFAPPAKKMKMGNHGLQLTTNGRSLDDTSYQRHLSALNKEFKKTVINRSVIGTLMAEMAPNRREWILKERLAVHEVLEMYPPLKDIELVRYANVYMSAIGLVSTST